MQVLIVGAGPCGLLLALFLQKQGIQTRILEASDKLDDQPRACHYGSAGKYEFARAGILDTIAALGFHPDSHCWRKMDGSLIVKHDHSKVPESSVHRIVCLELDRVLRIMYDEAVAHGCEVLMKHKVTSTIGQTADKAWVDVELPSGEIKRFEADYIVGCDGANSRIRKSLYGDTEYPGFTWDEQIIATNVYYPFEKFGYDDANFIVHPTDWYMAAKISNEGLWRVTYGDVPGLTKEQYTERLPMRYKQILPGQPEPADYKVTNVGPYRMHQRLAKSLRSGRFLLAGDSGHLCNPFGGLGLTGGLADVGSLQDALVGIHKGHADDSILDKYAEVRANIWRDIINVVSTENFKRLWLKDPETTIREDEFFEILRKAAKDEKLSQDLRDQALGVRYDMTVHYNKKANL